jgi:tetratricopeptide (TPR) repeat protein
MLAVARIFVLLSLALAAGNSAVIAQGVDDLQYADDYDRLMQIDKVTDSAKKAEQLIVFYKGRPKLDSRLRIFADNRFDLALKDLNKKQNYALLKKLSQSAIALRPKFGEAWLYYGVALKNEAKFDEALDAFAKSSIIESPRQSDAKIQLDLAYRGTHKGSLVGEDKLIAKAKAELK